MIDVLVRTGRRRRDISTLEIGQWPCAPRPYVLILLNPARTFSSPWFIYGAIISYDAAPGTSESLVKIRGVYFWLDFVAGCRNIRQGSPGSKCNRDKTGTTGTIGANAAADYWKSQNRKYCDFCKCWIADNKPSIDFHEGGRKHKENVSKRLKEIHKNSAKQAKQNKKFVDDIKKIENAAMAAYLKDVENNTRDMTAERIIKEKLDRIETKETPQNCVPSAAPETVPRFKSKTEQVFPMAADPCDPATLSKSMPSVRRVQQSGENRTPGKSKTSKTKGKGKKAREDDRPNAPVRKLWYEALSPEGYTYYWHIETNESVWEPPEEGYMTFGEQKEEAKEEVLQKELLEQLDKEEAIKKVDVIEEQRANIEREKMKQLRKHRPQATVENNDAESDSENAGVKRIEAEEERPYRRDYSVPERPQPYGSWQIVQTIEKKPIDLQLPKQKHIQVPTFEKNIERPPLRRTFKERTIIKINTGDSDDEGTAVTFKKRKIGNKNVRKRVTDD